MGHPTLSNQLARDETNFDSATETEAPAKTVARIGEKSPMEDVQTFIKLARASESVSGDELQALIKKAEMVREKFSATQVFTFSKPAPLV